LAPITRSTVASTGFDPKETFAATNLPNGRPHLL
jgi:hypothetical protein